MFINSLIPDSSLRFVAYLPRSF